MNQPAKKSFEELIQSANPVLVDFFADWCGPCRMLKPVLEDLKQRVGDKATIIKLDVDRNPGVAATYQIQGVPTLILFKSGKAVWRQSGVVPASQLAQVIDQHS